MTEGVAVAGLDGLTPLTHHIEIRRLEARDLAGHVDQVDAGVESPEQPMRDVEEGEGLLVPSHHLGQEGQLAGRFGLA